MYQPSFMSNRERYLCDIWVLFLRSWQYKRFYSIINYPVNNLTSHILPLDFFYALKCHHHHHHDHSKSNAHLIIPPPPKHHNQNQPVSRFLLLDSKLAKLSKDRTFLHLHDLWCAGHGACDGRDTGGGFLKASVRGGDDDVTVRGLLIFLCPSLEVGCGGDVFVVLY